MNVKTIHMSDLYNQCDDLYISVMIISKRAKQIIDERFVPIDENEDVEDSIEFDEPIISDYIEKPEAIALEEFLNGELEWRDITEGNQIEDES